MKRLHTVLTLFLSVVLLLPAVSVRAAEERLPGDVDADGKITAADARLTLRAAVGLEVYETDSDAFQYADVVTNQKLTAADARMILRCAVKLDEPAALTPAQADVYEYAPDSHEEHDAHFALTGILNEDTLKVSVFLCGGTG